MATDFVSLKKIGEEFGNNVKMVLRFAKLGSPSDSESSQKKCWILKLENDAKIFLKELEKAYQEENKFVPKTLLIQSGNPTGLQFTQKNIKKVIMDFIRSKCPKKCNELGVCMQDHQSCTLFGITTYVKNAFQVSNQELKSKEDHKKVAEIRKVLLHLVNSKQISHLKEGKEDGNFYIDKEIYEDGFKISEKSEKLANLLYTAILESNALFLSSMGISDSLYAILNEPVYKNNIKNIQIPNNYLNQLAAKIYHKSNEILGLGKIDRNLLCIIEQDNNKSHTFEEIINGWGQAIDEYCIEYNDVVN